LPGNDPDGEQVKARVSDMRVGGNPGFANACGTSAGMAKPTGLLFQVVKAASP
jgi:hypothetical protein